MYLHRRVSSSLSISTQIDDWQRHNLRAASLAGISHGLEIEPLIIQYEDAPAPVDYKERHRHDFSIRREVEQSVSEYCQETLVKNQRRASFSRRARPTILTEIDIGSSSAENESK